MRHNILICLRSSSPVRHLSRCVYGKTMEQDLSLAHTMLALPMIQLLQSMKVERERVEKATFLYAARSVIVATTLRRGRESFGSISISEICSLLRLLLRSPFSLLLLLLPRLLLLSVYGRSIPTKWSSRDVALTAPSSPFLI